MIAQHAAALWRALVLSAFPLASHSFCLLCAPSPGGWAARRAGRIHSWTRVRARESSLSHYLVASCRADLSASALSAGGRYPTQSRGAELRGVVAHRCVIALARGRAGSAALLRCGFDGASVHRLGGTLGLVSLCGGPGMAARRPAGGGAGRLGGLAVAAWWRGQAGRPCWVAGVAGVAGGVNLWLSMTRNDNNNNFVVVVLSCARASKLSDACYPCYPCYPIGRAGGSVIRGAHSVGTACAGRGSGLALRCCGGFLWMLCLRCCVTFGYLCHNSGSATGATRRSRLDGARASRRCWYAVR